MAQFTKPRGTVDLINNAASQFINLESILRFVATQYNLKEIRTPIFESRDLFTKSVGETSDIVNKEFYDFLDKGGRPIALRPEGTAGTIRALVENKLLLNQTTPYKCFYIGPMFRYERPQSGRQRQFHQFGVEIVGNLSIIDEIECISLAISIINACRITNYTLEINNIGSLTSRSKWIESLKKYFADFKDQLTEDSIRRLETNPLRILDDKIDGEKDFVKNAPRLDEFLTDDEKEYFKSITKYLDLMGIEYKVNNNLVRGLDYYCGLVFEFISKSEKLKGQSTILGGGRYDNLVKDTGGIDVPGVGFAIGIERLLIAINDECPNIFKEDKLDIVMAPLSQKAVSTSLLINMVLRNAGFKVDMHASAVKLDKHFKFADLHKPRFVLILGESELAEKKIIIKDQLTKTEDVVMIDDLIEHLRGIKNA
ncbi:MAG: histidine--tRNA ligase [Mycoplasma sp.]